MKTMPIPRRRLPVPPCRSKDAATGIPDAAGRGRPGPARQRRLPAPSLNSDRTLKAKKTVSVIRMFPRSLGKR